MWRQSVLLLFTLCLGVALCGEDSSTDNSHVVEDSRPLSSIRLPSELSLPSNLVTLLASAGAVVLGLASVAAIVSLLLPLFGLRACNLFNTCPPTSAASFLDNYAYNAILNPSAYNYDVSPYSAAQYQMSGASTGRDPASAASTAGGYPTASTNNYRKRSLDYVGPILKLLSTTYDKYAMAPRESTARYVKHINEELLQSAIQNTDDAPIQEQS